MVLVSCVGSGPGSIPTLAGEFEHVSELSCRHRDMGITYTVLPPSGGVVINGDRNGLTVAGKLDLEARWVAPHIAQFNKLLTRHTV